MTPCNHLVVDRVERFPCSVQVVAVLGRGGQRRHGWVVASSENDGEAARQQLTSFDRDVARVAGAEANNVDTRFFSHAVEHTSARRRRLLQRHNPARTKGRDVGIDVVVR